ncbi:formate/nitrite transporter family protein [Fusobacterium sp.]|uniref:formate/nitrite transporter family protein n=1 Tax=Fusobacterium sp. TaxID=68766 RepID=UPI002608E0D7|nr:formate/nitrite transporter family protein [Fusobacterium sp.]
MSKTFLNPVETTYSIIDMGITRGREKSSIKILISGFMAGMFISFASIGFLIAQTLDSPFSKFLGASVFPIGLMLCVFTGASLFTGNSLLSLSFLTKGITLFQLVRNLILVWTGNFLGSIFVAFVSFYSGTFSSQGIQRVVLDACISKTNIPFIEGIFSGFLCNMLVALGIIMALSATDAIGKLFACWFPIMLFVLSGYQHVVANMYIFSIGKLLYPSYLPILKTITNYLFPVTIGNFLSGGVFLPIILYILYVDKK